MNPRNPSLDVLRGVAVLMVVLSHYAYFSVLGKLAIGVDLFFVLSGFLISGLLFSELETKNTIRIGRFLIRRGFKIYPAFYFFFLISLPLMPAMARTPGRVAAELFYLQPYLPHIWQHTWSLGIEEQFYFLLPILLLILGRTRRLHWIPAISVGIVLWCSIARMFWSPNASAETHLRIDGLFAGVGLKYCQMFHREMFLRWARRWQTGIMGLVFLFPVLFSAENSRLGSMHLSLNLTCTMLGFSALLLFAQGFQLRNRAVEAVGRYSYSIYVWHMLVSGFWHGLPLSIWGFVGNVVTAILLGVIMAAVIEFPALAIRDRIFPSLTDAFPRQNKKNIEPVSDLAKDEGAHRQGEPAPA